MISEVVQSICSTGFNGINSSLKIECESGVCEAKIEFAQSLPTADVYLTEDFSLLFSREAVSPQATAQVRKEQLTLRNGVILNLSISDKQMPLVDDPKTLESMSACFRQVARQLKVKLGNELASEEKTPRQAADKPSTTTSTRLSDFAFGNLVVTSPNSVDIRDDAIIAIQFTSTQRFVFSNPSVDKASLAQIEQLLSSDKAIGARTAKIRGAKGSMEISNYSARTLIAAPSHHKSLSVELEGTDATLTPLTPTRQILTPMLPTRWIWKVKFSDASNISTLRLKLSDLGTGQSQATAYIHPLEVRLVKPWDYHIQKFFSTYWQWVVATFLSPIALHFWRQRQFAKVKPAHVPLRRKIAK